jgi:hypothetical protein
MGVDLYLDLGSGHWHSICLAVQLASMACRWGLTSRVRKSVSFTESHRHPDSRRVARPVPRWTGADASVEVGLLIVAQVVRRWAIRCLAATLRSRAGEFYDLLAITKPSQGPHRLF